MGFGYKMPMHVREVLAQFVDDEYVLDAVCDCIYMPAIDRSRTMIDLSAALYVHAGD